jgi:hypothetical protein
MNVRAATREDVPALLQIKRRLAFTDSSRGGFLLGCDEAGYEQRLRDGRVWVLAGAAVRGFAITLPAEALRSSALWALKDRVAWTAGVPNELDFVGYFDQLAVLPEVGRRLALELAFTALWELMKECRHVVTTTVSAPVRNLAAVPLIERLGGVRVGQLEEEYPGFGALTSDVWLLSTESVQRRMFDARAPVERWVRALVDPD